MMTYYIDPTKGEYLKEYPMEKPLRDNQDYKYAQAMRLTRKTRKSGTYVPDFMLVGENPNPFDLLRRATRFLQIAEITL